MATIGPVLAAVIAAVAALVGTAVGASQQRQAAAEARRVEIERRRASAYEEFMVAARRLELEIASTLRKQQDDRSIAQGRYGRDYYKHVDLSHHEKQLFDLESRAQKMCAEQAPLFLVASPEAATAVNAVCAAGTTLIPGKVSVEESHERLQCALNDFVRIARQDLGVGAGAGPQLNPVADCDEMSS